MPLLLPDPADEVRSIFAGFKPASDVDQDDDLRRRRDQQGPPQPPWEPAHAHAKSHVPPVALFRDGGMDSLSGSNHHHVGPAAADLSFSRHKSSVATGQGGRSSSAIRQAALLSGLRSPSAGLRPAKQRQDSPSTSFTATPTVTKRSQSLATRGNEGAGPTPTYVRPVPPHAPSPWPAAALRVPPSYSRFPRTDTNMWAASRGGTSSDSTHSINSSGFPLPRTPSTSGAPLWSTGSSALHEFGSRGGHGQASRSICSSLLDEVLGVGLGLGRPPSTHPTPLASPPFPPQPPSTSSLLSSSLRDWQLLAISAAPAAQGAPLPAISAATLLADDSENAEDSSDLGHSALLSYLLLKFSRARELRATTSVSLGPGGWLGRVSVIH